MKQIKLTQNQVALVDDDKFEELSKFKWYAKWNGKTKSFYAVRTYGKLDGKQASLRMHRIITNAPDGLQVDHINGDTLDNRLINLRVVTNRQNQQNTRKRKTSKYPGVFYFKKRNTWVAQIEIAGKSKHLGQFEEEAEAFHSYLRACRDNGFPVDFMVEKYIFSTQEPQENIHLDNTTEWTPEQILRNEG